MSIYTIEELKVIAKIMKDKKIDLKQAREMFDKMKKKNDEKIQSSIKKQSR